MQAWLTELESAESVAAALYDQLYPRIEGACIETLVQLAAGGRLLELGVGTGRCAGPLSQRGVAVVGIDDSAARLARAVRRWPGLALIRADLAHLPFRSCFRVAVSLVDTLSLMPSLEALRQALAGIAESLESGGVFVDESWREAAVPLQPRWVSQVIPIGDPQNGSALPHYALSYWEIRQAHFDALCADAGLQLRERFCTWRLQPIAIQRLPTISIYSR